MNSNTTGYSTIEGCVRQSNNTLMKKDIEEQEQLQQDLVEMILYKTFLQNEIQVLESRFKPHDTGHIKSAANTLTARVREIDRKIGNDPKWKDEYLLGV